MATFVWPPEVRWPPPANILANYDVVPPGVVWVQREDRQPTEIEMPLAWVQFLDAHGRPVDPGYGVEGGGYPDQGLPGGGGRPGHLPARPGRPIDPGFGNPGWGGGRPPIDPGYEWGGGERPGHLPAWRPGERPGQGLPHPGRPVDPGWGVEGGGEAGQLPVWPIEPGHPILPPIPGLPERPPIDPPPGTIWPPLPPGAGESGKVLVAVWISGVGHRYVVLTIPERPEGGGGEPDQGLPGRPGAPERPGHPIAPGGRPEAPERPSQPIAPGGRPGQPQR